MYKTIVLAYDGSESGQRALLDCQEIGQWSHAKLHLVAVMPPPMAAMAVEAWSYSPESDAAERAAETALIHHQRLPMPFETARTQLLLGQIQRRRRHRQPAQATLAAALATFESLGTPLWAGRTRAELERVNPGTAAGELTPAEERVARCAAAGLSNKEIAAELFLAPKTVEMNLSSVYRKLGIRSRSQLHSRLGENPNSRENPASHGAKHP